jgi:CheY-like chemotaxis protein
VVEDNAVNQLITRKILENWGHQVTIVEDGEQAVKTTEETDFDAILMDIQMPNMDGITATRLIRLRENNSGHHTPIIAVTAHAGENDQKACFEAGMDDFICKPLDKNRLKIALTKLA